MPVRWRLPIATADAKAEDGRARRNRGRRAEALALLALMLKGYRPVARNLRTPVGEIDLVMRRGGVLAVVEVKTRASLADAAFSIGAEQQLRLRRALEWLLSGRPDLARLELRFDAVLVAPRRWPRHLTGAWGA
jgi:putative endonuclease